MIEKKKYFQCPENTLVYNNTCVQAEGMCKIGDDEWDDSDISMLHTYYIDMSPTDSLEFDVNDNIYGSNFNSDDLDGLVDLGHIIYLTQGLMIEYMIIHFTLHILLHVYYVYYFLYLKI